MIDQNSEAFWWVFPLFFIFLWWVILTILSYVSGWASLAERYRVERGFTGVVWNWQSGEMRRVNFQHSLRFGADPTDLYLAMMPPFHFRTPPLLIPWNDVAVSRGKRFFFRKVRLELGRELRIPLWIWPSLADRLQQAAVGHWPVETQHN